MRIDETSKFLLSYLVECLKAGGYTVETKAFLEKTIEGNPQEKGWAVSVLVPSREKSDLVSKLIKEKLLDDCGGEDSDLTFNTNLLVPISPENKKPYIDYIRLEMVKPEPSPPVYLQIISEQEPQEMQAPQKLQNIPEPVNPAQKTMSQTPRKKGRPKKSPSLQPAIQEDFLTIEKLLREEKADNPIIENLKRYIEDCGGEVEYRKFKCSYRKFNPLNTDGNVDLHIINASFESPDYGSFLGEILTDSFLLPDPHHKKDLTKAKDEETIRIEDRNEIGELELLVEFEILNPELNEYPDFPYPGEAHGDSLSYHEFILRETFPNSKNPISVMLRVSHRERRGRYALKEEETEEEFEERKPKKEKKKFDKNIAYSPDPHNTAYLFNKEPERKIEIPPTAQNQNSENQNAQPATENQNQKPAQ